MNRVLLNPVLQRFVPLDWRNQYKDGHLIFNPAVLPALTVNVNNFFLRR